MNLMQTTLLLVSNYADDPLFSDVFTGTRVQQQRGMEAYFSAALDCCLEKGSLVIAPGNAGLAAWLPNGAFPPVIEENVIRNQPPYVVKGWEKLRIIESVAWDQLASYEGDFGFLWLWTVDFSVRGRGYGKMLLEEALEQMKAEGLKCCRLMNANIHNDPILSKMGFRELTTIHYQNGPGVRLVEKQLG